MPELAADPLAPANPPALPTNDALSGEQRFPPPWPGFPVGLEALSAAERASWGRRWGVDTPYLWAPSGWGERVPLVGDISGVAPANIIVGVNGPLALPRAYPRTGLFPRVGLYPRR